MIHWSTSLADDGGCSPPPPQNTTTGNTISSDLHNQSRFVALIHDNHLHKWIWLALKTKTKTGERFSLHKIPPTHWAYPPRKSKQKPLRGLASITSGLQIKGVVYGTYHRDPWLALPENNPEVPVQVRDTLRKRYHKVGNVNCRAPKTIHRNCVGNGTCLTLEIVMWDWSKMAHFTFEKLSYKPCR